MKQLNKLIELRSFLILWGSQSISSLGTAMTNFALIIWAYRQQGTASSITLLSVCSYLPYITIPIGLFLGGILADRIFEPFMLKVSPVQQVLSILVGTGKGSGMAVIFVVIGTVGFFASLFSLKNPIYKNLDL